MRSSGSTLKLSLPKSFILTLLTSLTSMNFTPVRYPGATIECPICLYTGSKNSKIVFYINLAITGILVCQEERILEKNSFKKAENLFQVIIVLMVDECCCSFPCPRKMGKAMPELSHGITLQDKLGPKGWNAKKSLAVFAKKAKETVNPTTNWVSKWSICRS